jgi:hypothetical protein
VSVVAILVMAGFAILVGRRFPFTPLVAVWALLFGACVAQAEQDLRGWAARRRWRRRERG